MILNIDYHITDKYVESFDGIFNGTLSYRDDSFIKDDFYSQSCNFKTISNTQSQRLYLEKIRNLAASKPR